MPGVHWDNNYSNKYGKVYQYDMDGNFIAEYNSIHDCKLLTKADYKTILRMIDGYKPVNSKCLYSTKFYMKYPLNILKTKKLTNSKPIYQYDLNGNFIKEWTSATEASKEYNVTRALITSSANTKIKTVKSAVGYLWSFQRFGKLKKHVKNWCVKKVLQYDLNGNFIKEWNSVIDASTELKISNGNIAMCAQGSPRRKTAGGYIWKYKD
jgi:hypothetical protein